MNKYANIIIEATAKNLNRPFTYRVPQHLKNDIDIGSIVEVPFGKNNKVINGYVIDFTDSIDFDENKAKDIIQINHTVSVEAEMIKLGKWMEKRYITSFHAAFNLMVPSSQVQNKKYKNRVVLLLDQDTAEEELIKLADKKKNNKLMALKILIELKELSEESMLNKSGITKAVLKTMEKQGWVKIIKDEIYRNPFSINNKSSKKIQLNEQQNNALNKINQASDNNENKVFLLHGITGSGKTEVYMQAIENQLNKNKQAIVLIPEIGLTPQMVNRFTERFGDIVGVMNSKLSPGEKYDQWRKAKEGIISIMIGPRSAIFTPFSNIGIIIIDEEHEMTYKSEMPPKFHAREVAIKRASLGKYPVVLGSATPLLESYHKALDNKYELLELDSKAIENASLETVIADMREELVNGNKTILSSELNNAIASALARKEQIILFINRRGYASFVSCRKCGYVIKCSSCDISMTYHATNKKMICHYCGNSHEKPKECPNCGSIHIKEVGTGTQKVEQSIKKLFPDARVSRMDMDTTTKKNDTERILLDFNNKQSDILIGTQMIAKGHHFENVTLVGVILADTSLFLEDFRACEKTFQLITQVTGRTGRAEKPGKAIIQTYSPEHYAIITAANQSYREFYDKEIAYRKLMDYPPFSNIGTIMISAREERDLISEAYQIKDLIVKLAKDKEITVLGPTPAQVSKVKNVFRWRIIVKSKEYKPLNILLYNLNQNIVFDNRYNKINLQIDINPMMSY